MLKNIIVLSLILTGLNSFACDEQGKTGFLPENDLYISVSNKNANDMTEERFNEIIDKVDKQYAPIVEARGKKLKFNRKWNDGTVNASAQRSIFFGNYIVNMYGGLARHELVTDDGFALVVCHEMGHHLGGAPKVGGMMSWAANEGQSDWWGAAKCFRRTFESEDNEAIVAKMNVPATIQTKCEKNFTLANDVALCVRSSMAGISLAKLLGSLRNNTDISIDTPDTNVVSSTNSKHPAAQCRLDTYFQGSICEIAYQDDVDEKDPLIGTCNREAGHVDGLRPLCWYAPGK
ncbi:MAG: hypothetical protein CME62_07890 [Halobacteriovoraceae bacterium]|nr:hypothetical protein [Halobacteriovoraceae bacterium]|tara:strand:+ start:1022 stop:1891 length:870 start_codon:yes stop_codon:yes gene_type:complete